jgi:hypothetical protein
VWRPLEQDQTSLAWLDLWTLPVVEIVLQVPVPDPELEVLEDRVVLHEVQAVVDIDLLRLRQGESILEEVQDGDGGGDVVVGVSSVECGVLGVTDDGGGQVVEREEVRHSALVVLWGGRSESERGWGEGP